MTVPAISTHHRLSDRHIQFITIGGSIGAGLFLGSGRGIALAGPALLAVYSVCGLVVYLLARALAEMILSNPVQGGFSVYAENYLGPTAGFLSGWSYWANWILVAGAELTAIGVLVRFWLPDMPQWLAVLVSLMSIVAMNIGSVRLFGEFEFWLALIKIGAIVLFIVGGVVVLLIDPPHGAGLINLWPRGAIAPGGVSGLVAALPIALFAFGGVEVLALTAADAVDPARVIPKAVNGVVARILIFYIGSLALIMTIAPWPFYSAAQSPFVAALGRLGVPLAASIINFVVISAVLSSCNTGLFSTGRMLASLAERDHAPYWLARRNASGSPVAALLASTATLSLTVVLNWAVPDQALGILMTAVALLLLSIWLTIMLSHWMFRKRQPNVGIFRMPIHPISSAFVMAAIVGVALALTLAPGSRLAMIVLVAWVLGLCAVHRILTSFRSASHRSAATPPLDS